MISTEDTLWSRRSAGLLLILAAVLLSTVCAVGAAVLSVEALSAQVGEEKEIHQYGADSPHTDSELGPGGWAILPPGSLFDGVEGAFLSFRLRKRSALPRCYLGCGPLI